MYRQKSLASILTCLGTYHGPFVLTTEIKLNGTIVRNLDSHDIGSQSALTEIPLSTKLRNSKHPLEPPHATPLHWPFFLLRSSVLRHVYGPAFGFMGSGGCWTPVAGSTRPLFGRSRLSRSLLGAQCQSCVSTLQLWSVCVPNIPGFLCQQLESNKECDRSVPSSRSLAPKRVRRCSWSLAPSTPGYQKLLGTGHSKMRVRSVAPGVFGSGLVTPGWVFKGVS
jgi:hypothetical protein